MEYSALVENLSKWANLTILEIRRVHASANNGAASMRSGVLDARQLGAFKWKWDLVGAVSSYGALLDA
jgi:hypothetical protein